MSLRSSAGLGATPATDFPISYVQDELRYRFGTSCSCGRRRSR